MPASASTTGCIFSRLSRWGFIFSTHALVPVFRLIMPPPADGMWCLLTPSRSSSVRFNCSKNAVRKHKPNGEGQPGQEEKREEMIHHCEWLYRRRPTSSRTPIAIEQGSKAFILKCRLSKYFAASCHTFCRDNEKPSIGSTRRVSHFCIRETAQRRLDDILLFVWLYKAFVSPSKQVAKLMTENGNLFWQRTSSRALGLRRSRH